MRLDYKRLVHKNKTTNAHTHPSLQRYYYSEYGFFDEDEWSLVKVKHQISTSHYVVEELFPI